MGPPGLGGEVRSRTAVQRLRSGRDRARDRTARRGRVTCQTDVRIGALWIGGALSYLEQLCLRSFVDAGHAVRLYTYDGVPNAPMGVEVADAASVLPQAGTLRHERTGSPALHSDLFRYHLLAREEGMIWADTDAYCVKPFATATGHFHAWEGPHGLNGGVLGLPRDSETLRALLAFTADPHAVPPWYDAATRAAYEATKARGAPVHASEMPWGVWGPHALTHFLKATGEVRYSMPQAALYPIAFKDRRDMLRPGFDETPYVTEETFSIHFYGRRMRARILEKEPSGVPRPRSLIGRLLKRHGIDPALAPLRRPPIAGDGQGARRVGPGRAPLRQTQGSAAITVPAPATPSAPDDAPAPRRVRRGGGASLRPSQAPAGATSPPPAAAGAEPVPRHVGRGGGAPLPPAQASSREARLRRPHRRHPRTSPGRSSPPASRARGASCARGRGTPSSMSRGATRWS